LDGLVLRRQVTTVEEARFGEPVDEAAFTPAGLELKPGREVVDSTSGQPWLKVWDGKKLADSSGVQTAPANPDRRHWVLWALAIGLALLSIFYIRRIIRQRRSASNPGV
ncbi:MAG TPA: hypothetical protein VH575_04655, partial [Gemmataceae bacterium]